MMLPMLMGKKRIILYGVLAVVLVVSAAYLLLPNQLKLSYVIDDAHLSEVEPQGTWANMTCPQCGSKLEEIVIGIYIDAGSFAYYCREEDIFWVCFSSTNFNVTRWYGPFNAYWKLTNAVAISGVIISGVALVLLAIKDKDLIRGY